MYIHACNHTCMMHELPLCGFRVIDCGIFWSFGRNVWFFLDHFPPSAYISWSRTQFQLLSENVYYLLSVNLLVFPFFSEAGPWASWIMWRSHLCYCHYRMLAKISRKGLFWDMERPLHYVFIINHLLSVWNFLLSSKQVCIQNMSIALNFSIFCTKVQVLEICSLLLNFNECFL